MVKIMITLLVNALPIKTNRGRRGEGGRKFDKGGRYPKLPKMNK
jgi:hypothetical protein